MISGSINLGILFVVTISFFVPVVILMWLMIKRHAKMIIYMLLFGVFARIPGLIVQTIVLYGLDSIDGYTNIGFAVRSIINNTVYAAVCVVSIAVLLMILKKNGLTYNRAWTIAVGYSALDVIVATGLSYMMKMMNIALINDGSIYTKYGAAEAASLVKDINNLTIGDCVNDAFGAVITIFISALCIIVLLYGLAKAKLLQAALISFFVIFIYRTGDSLITEYLGNKPACAFKLIVFIGIIGTMFRLQKNEKEMMIKPESMTNGTL